MSEERVRTPATKFRSDLIYPHTKFRSDLIYPNAKFRSDLILRARCRR